MTGNGVRARQAVELVDMLPFDGGAFMSAINSLVRVEIIAAADPAWVIGETSRIEAMKAWVTRLRTELLNLDLPMTARMAEEVLGSLGFADKASPASSSVITNEIREMRTRLAHELEGKMVYGLTAREAQWVKQTEPLFGTAVADKFPSASTEIEEAGKCIGFSRYTAAVFHLMRVMEIGLNALGRELGLAVAQNWHTALRDIEEEVKTRNKGNQGPNWAADEPFFSEAAAYFRVLKNAWRNHTMHITNTYDEERALAVYNTTRDFMRHLAVRLSD